jgi:hypothetical protein
MTGSMPGPTTTLSALWPDAGPGGDRGSADLPPLLVVDHQARHVAAQGVWNAACRLHADIGTRPWDASRYAALGPTGLPLGAGHARRKKLGSELMQTDRDTYPPVPVLRSQLRTWMPYSIGRPVPLDSGIVLRSPDEEESPRDRRAR